LEAQRAETDALRDVGKVARRLESIAARVEAVDLELAKAQSDLVAVSGLPRAAQLLGMEPRDLRRRVKRAIEAAAESKPGGVEASSADGTPTSTPSPST
jgi:hypothetical protein